MACPDFLVCLLALRGPVVNQDAELPAQPLYKARYLVHAQAAPSGIIELGLQGEGDHHGVRGRTDVIHNLLRRGCHPWTRG